MKIKLKKEIFKVEYIIFTFLWPLLIMPKTISLGTFLLIGLVLCYKNKSKLLIDKITITMWVMCTIHIISIMHNAMFLNSDTSRIPAAINTALLWFVAGLFYSVYRCIGTKLNIDTIGYICCINIVVLFVLGIFTAYLWFVRGELNYVIFGRALFDTTYLDGEAGTKFIGLNEFSNMNLFFVMLMVMLSYTYLKKRKLITKTAILVMASICVLLIHSRSGYVLFAISIFYMYYGFVPRKYKKVLLFVVILMTGVVFSLEFRELYLLFNNKILNGNVSSNNFRLLLLTTSWQEALEKSPIIGMGIKRYLFEGYPLGSHSTYIGFFYKTGIVGLILGLFVIIKLNYNVCKRIVCNTDFKPMLVFLISFIVLFAIEDVDGANWSIVLYFTSLALLYSNNYEKRGRNEHKNFSNISTTVSSNRV